MNFEHLKINSETFKNELPVFAEHVPDFGSVIYDPATDPVMELTQHLTKDYPEKYYKLKDR